MEAKRRKQTMSIWLIGFTCRVDPVRGDIQRILESDKGDLDYQYVIPEGIAILPIGKKVGDETIEQHHQHVLILTETLSDGKRIAHKINNKIGLAVQVIELDTYLTAK